MAVLATKIWAEPYFCCIDICRTLCLYLSLWNRWIRPASLQEYDVEYNLQKLFREMTFFKRVTFIRFELL